MRTAAIAPAAGGPTFRVCVGDAPQSASNALADLHAAAFTEGRGAGRAWSGAMFDEMRAAPPPPGVVRIWAEVFAVVGSAEDGVWTDGVLTKRVLAGFAAARAVGDDAELLTLCRAPAFRHARLGGALLSGLEAALRRRDVARVLLEVSALNASARRLYDDHGYREVGRRRGYYAESGQRSGDALILEKCLRALE